MTHSQAAWPHQTGRAGTRALPQRPLGPTVWRAHGTQGACPEMKLCLRTDVSGNDLKRLGGFCRTLGITDVWSVPERREHREGSGLVSADRLRAYVSRLAAEGLRLRTIFETVATEDIASQTAAAERIQRLQATLRAMAAVGLDVLFVFVPVAVGQSTDCPAERWDALTEFYRAILPCAEECGVRLATHGHQEPGFLLFEADSLQRLLAVSDSPSHGITLCTGCLGIAGDDVPAQIRRLAERIFFVHLRDVVKRPDGFDEVLYGRGQVDVRRVIEGLQQIHYQGFISPEHLPRSPDEPFEETGAAHALGYLAALGLC